MGRIVQRTFSGYRINWDQIPNGDKIKITARDVRTGERWALEDTRYWIQQPIWSIFEACQRN